MAPLSVLVGVGVVVVVAVVVIDSRKMLVQTLVMKDERQPIHTYRVPLHIWSGSKVHVDILCTKLGSEVKTN